MKENYVYPAKIKHTGAGIETPFIDFPDVVTFAENLDDVITAAQEALALVILDLENTNGKIPEPTMTQSDVLYVHVWMPYFRNISREIYVKKSVTIPQWLDILAKNKSINFSATLVKAIKAELGIK